MHYQISDKDKDHEDNQKLSGSADFQGPVKVSR
jgi:hypothetical protein